MVEETQKTPQLVRDLMTVGVPTCSPDTPLVDLARLILQKDLEAVVVLDPWKGMLSGWSAEMNWCCLYLVRRYEKIPGGPDDARWRPSGAPGYSLGSCSSDYAGSAGAGLVLDASFWRH